MPMTLLNAPTYDEGKEHLKRNILIGAASAVVLLILLTLGGYLLGHGWLFSNLPAEHRVSEFFAALHEKDYGKAFGIYYNDPEWAQHAAKYKDYPEAAFADDWAHHDPVNGPVNTYHVDISRTDGAGTFGTGIIVAVRVNGDKKVFMYYVRKDGTLTWPAYHQLQY
jgi:hypothetical protein